MTDNSGLATGLGCAIAAIGIAIAIAILQWAVSGFPPVF